MILSTTCVIPKVFLQAVIAAADPPEVATKYASTRDAAKALLAEKPKVVAFGEVHPKWDFNYKSTKARFAESIVPELAASGIKDLVVEQISDDPAIGRELERYFTGKCELNEKEMPNFFADIDISDKADLLLMIKKCKESGIRVHAGGMTLAQETETVKQTDYSENLELKKKAMRYNGTATKKKIEALLRSDPARRLAVYGGEMHNNLTDLSERIENGTNWGSIYANKFSKKYLEVDLFISEQREEYSGVIRINSWKNNVPTQGATVIRRESYCVLFAGPN